MPNSSTKHNSHCDQDCTAHFNRNAMTIFNKHGSAILTGHRNNNTNGLWHITLPNHHANKITQPAAAQMVRFAHAALGSPALTALHQALKRRHIHGFSGLTEQTLRTEMATPHCRHSKMPSGPKSKKPTQHTNRTNQPISHPTHRRSN